MQDITKIQNKMNIKYVILKEIYRLSNFSEYYIFGKTNDKILSLAKVWVNFHRKMSVFDIFIKIKSPYYYHYLNKFAVYHSRWYLGIMLKSVIVIYYNAAVLESIPKFYSKYHIIENKISMTKTFNAWPSLSPFRSLQFIFSCTTT